MIRYFFIVIFIGFSCSALWAQGENPFDPKHPDFQLLSECFLKEINAHRQLLNMGTLVLDNDLYKAAQDQAEYQQNTGALTHTQKTAAKATPSDRVFYYGGNHEGVGENCLFTNNKKADNGLYTYAEMAAKLFQQWKDSPPHYAKICTPGYCNTGLGFAIDAKNNRLYAAEVFSKHKFSKPFAGYPETPNSWGVKYDEDQPCRVLPNVEFLKKIMANYLVRRHDSIFLYYRDINQFRQLIADKGDGLAVDLIVREQLVCGGEHNFHGSPVHDGVMLRPLYRDDILKNNRYAKFNEIYVFMGKIPDVMRDEDISMSTIVIKNGYRCEYSYPVDVPNSDLRLLEVEPLWAELKGTLKPGKYSEVFNFRIPFEQGETVFDASKLVKALEKLKAYKPYVNEVNIESFASVEGNHERNIQLQQQRAKSIYDCVKPYLAPNAQANFSGKINYDLLRKQVVKTKLDYLKNFSNEAIDKKLAQPKFLDSIAQYLPAQRVATVKIKVNVSYDDKTPPEYLHAALIHRIKGRDSVEIRKINTRLLQAVREHKISAAELCKYRIPLDKVYTTVACNYIGAWLKCDSIFYRGPQLKYFVNARKIFAQDKKFIFNSNLYALKVLAMRDTAIVPIAEIESWIQRMPPKAQEVKNNANFIIDFYLLAIPYYESHRQYAQMGQALTKLKALLTKTALTEEEALELAHYFNDHYRFDWSLDLLNKFIDERTWKNPATFMFYFKTATLYRVGISPEKYEALLERAPTVNVRSFCHWINDTNPQLLRDKDIKKQYCAFCEELKER